MAAFQNDPFAPPAQQPAHTGLDPFAPVQQQQFQQPVQQFQQPQQPVQNMDPFAPTPAQAPVQHASFDPFASPVAAAVPPAAAAAAAPHDPFNPTNSAHFEEEPFGNVGSTTGTSGVNSGARPPSPPSASVGQNVVGGDGGLFDTLAAHGGEHAPPGDFVTGYNKKHAGGGAGGGGGGGGDHRAGGDDQVVPGASAGGAGSGGGASTPMRNMVQDNVTPLLVDKVHGECLSRISARTMLTKAWKPCFWVFDTPSVLMVFRERQHYREYGMNPFLDDDTRGYLQKKRIELAANYRCTPVTRKPYGHGDQVQMLYHFTIEEIRDYGAVPIIKFADRELDVLEEIRKAVHTVVYDARVRRQSKGF